MTEVQVHVDDDLIALLDAQAAESGRTRNEVLAAAIRRGLGGGRLAESLAAERTGAAISEGDAMILAKEQLAATRGERRAT